MERDDPVKRVGIERRPYKMEAKGMIVRETAWRKQTLISQGQTAVHQN